jgi:hypothetical protein
MFMKCAEFVTFLDGDRRGELPAECRHHAASCSHCAEELDTRHALRTAFDGWAEVEPTSDLAARALRRCVKEAPAHRGFPRFGWLALAGAAAVVLGLFVRPGLAPSPPRDAPPAAFTREQREVLSSLGKAATRVAIAREETFGSLQKAIQAAERQGE